MSPPLDSRTRPLGIPRRKPRAGILIRQRLGGSFVQKRLACTLSALLTTVALAACAFGADVVNPDVVNPDVVNPDVVNNSSGTRILIPPGVNQPCPRPAGTGVGSGVGPDTPEPKARQGSVRVPVVLIHGTFANANRAFKTLAPLLLESKACVFAINYGKRSALPSVYATGDMRESAEEIRLFIDQVRQQTGSGQVDLVGHSQGGTLALYLGQQADTRGSIRRVVAISPSIRGTTTAKMLPAETRCTACSQQAIDAPFIQSLNAGPINPSQRPTLILSTDNDRVVTPVASQRVDEPGVTNLRLQQLVPGRYATHSGILHDLDAMRLVTQWLALVDPHQFLKP